MSLADRRCRPAARGTPPLDAAQLAPLAAEVPCWTVEQDRRIRRAFRFPDFATALAFVNAVGAEAESQGHHPDLSLGWGRVEVTLTTHDIGGLAESDFILAARIDRIASG